MVKPIIGVALLEQSTGRIFSRLAPYRHHHIINCDIKHVDHVGAGFIQGFIDQDYKFLNRREAFKRALLTFQIRTNRYGMMVLTSEDLW